MTVVLGNRRNFTIAPGSPISVGSHPSSVTVGDLNGDRKADIVVANLRRQRYFDFVNEVRSASVS